MIDNSGKILDKVKPSRIIWPILIGIAITAYMMRDFDYNSLTLIKITKTSILFLLLAIGLMLFRDIGYIWRLRVLSDGKLTWLKCIQIVILWEFTSAITPSAVGGTSVAIFFINKEGMSLGMSSAIVLMTSFLDELYFVIVFPIILLLVIHWGGFSANQDNTASIFQNNLFVLALIGYSLKLLYTIFVFYGLFINPRGLKWLLLLVFKLPIIRKWRPQANSTGDDLVKASLSFKKWPLKQWLKAILATSLSWTSRYWVANALIAFLFGGMALDFHQHIVVFGKQLVLWVMMLIMPTPGGSGFVEYFFNEFLKNDLPASTENLTMLVAFLWRLISYYPYLILGAILVPIWIRKHFIKTK